ncbi:hypothetical protein [Glutamicibacter sp. BSL13]
MLEMPIADDDDTVQTFRVGVDFSVVARDMHEAHALLERTLEQEGSDGFPFVIGDRLPDAAENNILGVIDRQPVPPRPSQAALVQQTYPRLIGDVAVVEGLREMLRSQELSDRMPEQTRQRIQQAVDDADPEIIVEESGQWTRRLFEGRASDAATHLADGVYPAFTLDDREYALVVAPSELTPSGRISAAFPKERHEGKTLDEISRLLQGHTREQPLPDLVRLISRRVNTTGRDAFPSWVPLEGEPEPAPLPARAYVGVISWSDMGDVEPTVIADASATAMARRLATTLHEALSDRDAFAGAAEFLETHSSPDEWRRPEDVGAWLDDLRAATPYPAFWYQQISVGNAPGPAGDGQAPATGSPSRATAPGAEAPDELGSYRVPVDFDVSARSASEARRLVDDALMGDAAPATPAAVQQRQQVRSDGDVYGVLGWHHPDQSLTGSVDPVREVLSQRARDITPDSGGKPPMRSSGSGVPEPGL